MLQCLIAVFIILAGYRFEVNFGPLFDLGEYGDLLSIALTFLWVIGVMNAFNLIDGLDGLAGGLSLIAILGITLVEMTGGVPVQLPLILAISGAILGFLRHNYHPASIFMGDTGSLLLGFFVSVYALQMTSAEGSFALAFLPPLLVAIPVFDTLSSMVRRKLRGRPVFYPDREHIHHRLRFDHGFSHRGTVLTLYALASAYVGFALLLALAVPYGVAASLLVLMLALAFLIGMMYKLDYLNWQRYRRNRRRGRRPVGLRLGGLRSETIRWEPEKLKRSNEA